MKSVTGEPVNHPIRKPPPRRIPLMPVPVRRGVLVLHIAGSAGWIGLTLALGVLVVTGLSTDDGTVRRSAYESIGLLGGTLLAPFGVTALVTGLLLGLGTRWGLIQHWWVLTKLVLTLALVTGGLVFGGARFAAAADRARELPAESLTAAAMGPVRIQVLAVVIAELVLLTTSLVFSVYRLGGRTPFDRRSRVAG